MSLIQSSFPLNKSNVDSKVFSGIQGNEKAKEFLQSLDFDPSMWNTFLSYLHHFCPYMDFLLFCRVYLFK